jgi:hypothetical protein
MISLHRTARLTAPGIVVLAIVTVLAPPAAAQAPSDTLAGRVTVAGGVEFLNAYSFRGIRQDDTGVVMWPYASLGLRVYEGTGGLKAIRVNAGTWNSLHTGIVGSDGPSGARWYQSDIHTTLDLTLTGGVTVGTTYRAYTSPNDMFTTVKEMSLRLAVDDRAALGRGAVRPYALMAFELDTKPGIGQADGGFDAGRYLELGAAPGYEFGRIGLAFPVRVGLSLGGYYELAGKDHRFGYFSASSLVTVPLGGRTALGAWNVHGGVDYQALGTTAKAFNNGDASTVIGSIGVGWSR